VNSDAVDQIAKRLGAGASRRLALGVLAGAILAGPLAGLDPLESEAKNGKHKRKKKKKKRRQRSHAFEIPEGLQQCRIAPNITLVCAPGHDCCDPAKSTGVGCAPAGLPVCCVSDGFAHAADIVCCASPLEGLSGVCVASHPHCCPASIGGCCIADYPVCCSGTPEPYCCPAGTTCCEGDPSGCCEDAPAAGVRAATAVGRGTWTAHLGGQQ
jgi:hypothetical protein